MDGIIDKDSNPFGRDSWIGFPVYNSNVFVTSLQLKQLMKQLQSAVICCIGIKLYDLSSVLKDSDNVSSKHPEIIKRNEQIILASHQTTEIDRFKIFKNG